MAEITAQMVKELREKSGAGMLDCKKALTESDGDSDKAMQLLRERGAAIASKRSSRVAKEGLISVHIAPTAAPPAWPNSTARAISLLATTISKPSPSNSPSMWPA